MFTGSNDIYKMQSNVKIHGGLFTLLRSHLEAEILTFKDMCPSLPNSNSMQSCLLAHFYAIPNFFVVCLRSRHRCCRRRRKHLVKTLSPLKFMDRLA